MGSMVVKWIVVAGAVAGLVGVALGAFGAHAIKGQVAPERIGVWETAVLYHLIHALALVAVGLCAQWLGARGLLIASGVAFLVGLVLFSGSLYVLVLSGVRVLGAITPIGGVAYLVGWALFSLAVWRA